MRYASRSLPQALQNACWAALASAKLHFPTRWSAIRDINKSAGFEAKNHPARLQLELTIYGVQINEVGIAR
ncbi:hypothetical protein [Caballeronia grimmiae]|uniref:hypothetical protein n=1 Tax=Caballeronia grimmiae TaxID=1071679 RepID=UPI0038B8018F